MGGLEGLLLPSPLMGSRVCLAPHPALPASGPGALGRRVAILGAAALLCCRRKMLVNISPVFAKRSV